MKERYLGNLGAFSKVELAVIRRKSVCVVGCGGLGGFVLNALARFGVGRLTLVDGDNYSEGNLNRQLFARPDTLGKNKAFISANELQLINADVDFRTAPVMLGDENAGEILSGHNLVIDCLDTVGARIFLEEHCAKLGLTLIHGAISGCSGQVAVVPPKSGLIKRLYSGQGREGAEVPKGNPVFTAQAVSAIQCAQAIMLLAGRESPLMDKLMFIDMETNAFEVLTV
jgi:molybdopterin/thiamine biosynthesis adenylyltransferase